MHKPGSDILLGSIEQTPDDLQTLTDNISFNTRFETNLYQHFDNNLLYKYINVLVILALYPFGKREEYFFINEASNILIPQL